MAVGEIITVTRYNQMQAKVALVYGNGSGTYGYGQTLNSSAVSTSDTVNAFHMTNLKTDMINARVHQTGASPTLSNVISQEDITDAVYVQYESASTSILNDAAVIFATTQASTEPKLTSDRSTSWGGTSEVQSVEHHFTVTFNSEDHRRHFFNSGGEIRLAASLTGGTGSKYTEWNGMLSALGTIKITSNNTTADSGTSSGLGNFDLTTSYQTLLIKTGSGVYVDNDYTLKAKANGSVITIKAEFNDDAAGSGAGGHGPIDESVTGTLTSSVSQLRATGSYVEVATPIYVTTTPLA